MSSWQRLHHNRTAHIWSSIHIHYVCWGKMLRIGNDVILSIGQVSVFVHRKVFPILCYSFNDGLIRTSIQNSNEHHVVNDVTTMQLAPLLFSESLCWKKYFRGSFGHTGGRVFVVISSKNIAALPPHFVYTGSSKQSVMTWWVRQLERIMTSIGDLAVIFLWKLSICGREQILAASCWFFTQRMAFSYIWKFLQKKTAVFWMFWWLNRRCRFCSSSVKPVQLSITWRTHSDALFRLESLQTHTTLSSVVCLLSFLVVCS